MNMNPFPNLTQSQRETLDRSVKEFQGFSDNLSAALGALAAGQYFGWRGLFMIHTRGTVKKYEKILGLDFKDCMPERTDYTDRLLGIRLADELGKFWAVVKGEVPVPGGKAYMDSDEQHDLFHGGERGRTT